MLKGFKSTWLLLLIVPAFIMGCATMSKDECLTADWKERGRQDGMQGKAASYLAKHSSACSEHGVTPDSKQYRAGRVEGLKVFCTPQNAFEYGIKGRSYTPGTCPMKLEKKFMARYRLAKEIHLLRTEVDKLKKDIESNEKKVIGDGLSSAQRQNLIYQNKDLNRKKDEKMKRLYYLEGKAGISSSSIY